MEFHAHIYFDGESREGALALNQALQQVFGQSVKVHQLIDFPVGPHLWPMFEVEFEDGLYPNITEFLSVNHGSLPVLIHPLSGDEYADHSDLAQWLGQELPLDFSKL